MYLFIVPVNECLYKIIKTSEIEKLTGTMCTPGHKGLSKMYLFITILYIIIQCSAMIIEYQSVQCKSIRLILEKVLL